MPLYEFKCRKCRLISTTTTYGETPTCAVCSAAMNKVFSFNMPAFFEPHFNITVGEYVTNYSDFKEKLRIKGEENAIRTGYPTNYVPIESGDREAFGVTEEGQDEFDRTHYAGTFDDPDARMVMNS